MEETPDKKRNKHILEIIAENEKSLSSFIKTIKETINETTENIANQFIKHHERERKFSIKMSALLAVLVAFIVSVAAFLTYDNKIDGATFTFLLGLIVGYVLTFFTGLIYPPE